MNRYQQYIFGAIIGCFLMLNVGCSSSHEIRLLKPEERDVLLNSSTTVIAGTVIDIRRDGDLTLDEQVSPGMPSQPKNPEKLNFTIRIDSVIKGAFNGSELRLHDLRDPSQGKGIAGGGLWLGPKQKVFVGWQSESGGNYQGLMIVNAEKVLDTTTSP